MLLLALLLPAASMAHASRWAVAASVGIYVDTTLSLAPNAPAPAPAYGGVGVRFGMADLQPQITAPFRRVQVNWAASIPADAQVRIDVRNARNDSWSDWTLAVQPGEIITFDRVGTRVQARVTLLGNAHSPQVEFVELQPLALSANDQFVSTMQEPLAPTYHIRATRMGLVGDRTANGHIIQPNDWFVSLPSFRSLSSLGGSEYMARLSYKGRSVVVPVWEVGPWNIHDDYWNIDRERFNDLPVGWPQDHAAYFDGYNGGWAEKGRVRFPTAADVGDGAWVALGIPFNDEQEEIDITFLWLGSDPGPNPTPLEVGSWTPPPPPPLPEGTIQVDTSDPGFNRSNVPWYNFACGIGNSSVWTYSTTNPAHATNNATWTAAPTGEYEVSVHVPYCLNGKGDTTAARYVVRHRDGETSVTINQAQHAGSWVSLGRYAFDGHAQVYLSDLAGDSWRSVWFDAVRWTP